MDDLVDIGVNLAHRSFAADLPAVLQRAREAGVATLIITGTSERTSEDALTLARAHGVYSTAGVHPHDAARATPQTLHTLKTLLAEPQVVAVGECGLDFNRDFSPRDVQEQVFEMQLELARQMGKPLFLHERDAHDRFMAVVRNHPGLAGVVHCFTGTAQEARVYVDAGFHLGITGWICDERRGEALRSAVRHIPHERLLVETDAPFLIPRTIKPRPHRNEPAFLPHVVRALALCLGRAPEDVARVTTDNARRLFGLAHR